LIFTYHEAARPFFHMTFSGTLHPASLWRNFTFRRGYWSGIWQHRDRTKSELPHRTLIQKLQMTAHR